MSLRARLFILISLTILVILGISLFLLSRVKKTTPAEQNQANTTTNNSGTTGQNPVISAKPSTLSPLEREQTGVRQLAKIFTERYGTYSTDNNYENIKEVESVVTPDLWKKLSAKLSTPATGPFYGVTTQVLRTDLAQWGTTSATVTVQAVKNVTSNGQTSKVYQNANVTLVKTGEDWLISSFAWVK